MSTSIDSPECRHGWPVHHPRPCPNCEAEAQNSKCASAPYERHWKAENGVFVYVCKGCNAEFSDLIRLNSHYPEPQLPKVRAGTTIEKAKRRVVKLLRDLRFSANPEYKGPPYETARVPNDKLHTMGLCLKLHEEACEVQENLQEPEEYADLVQAAMDLAELNGVSWEEVERIRIEKARDSGRFLKKAYMWRNFGDSAHG